MNKSYFMGMIVASLISTGIFAQTKPAMPSPKFTPAQMACLQKAMGKNVHPTPKQMGDAFKSCGIAAPTAPKATTPDKPATDGK